MLHIAISLWSSTEKKTFCQTSALMLCAYDWKSDNFVFTVKIYQVDNVLKLLFSTGPDKARNDLTIRQSRLLKF